MLYTLWEIAWRRHWWHNYLPTLLANSTFGCALNKMSKNNYTMSQKTTGIYSHFLANFTNTTNTILMSITLGTENLHLILNYIKQFMKAMFAAGYQPRPSPEQLSLIMHHASNTHWPCVKKFSQCCVTRLNTGKDTTRTSRPVNKWGNRKHHFISGNLLSSYSALFSWVTASPGQLPRTFSSFRQSV